MDNPLSQLTIDYWYKALMVVCAVIFLACGADLLKAFPVVPTAAISAGGFFVGLGEWINHPLQTKVGAGMVISGHPRNNSAMGLLFVLGGLALVGFGLYRGLS